MATYEVGQTIVWGLKTYDAAGALADVGTLPTATITKPDATTVAGSVAKTATGTYTISTPASALGRYTCQATGSGANSAGLPFTDHADVLDMSRLIVPLGEARDALNTAASEVTNDAELRRMLAAATLVVESIHGPVLPATKVETRSGLGRSALALREMPAAITSVTENGVVLAEGTGFVWDEFGLLWRGSEPYAGCWSTTPRGVVVTYTVGASIVPASVSLATAHLVRHWWQQTQQSGRLPFGGFDAEVAEPSVMVAGYAVPNFVADLLAPAARRTPGFA